MPRRTAWRARTALAALAVLAAVMPFAVAQADEVRDAQWHVGSLDLATAHAITRGEGVTVAVIDTGVDATHPDLRRSVLPGIDLVDPDNDNAWTPESHGTLVAGVIGAHGHGPDNGDGVLGVAPGASILPIRASTGQDDSPTSHLLPEAIDTAVAHGAGVITISLSTGRSGIDERAVAAARRADVVVVAAAGNRPDAEAVTFPAALPGVLATGGVDRAGDHADFSVTGPEIALVAPADEIVTTSLEHGYAIATGTSFAAPIVAGAAALLRARYPHLTADEVIHRLVATADPGPDGPDERYGHGVVNVMAALTADVPPPQPDADPPDETRLGQWHLDLLDLPRAHEISRGEGVTVALVGGGVDATHPDLHHNVLPGVDLVDPANRDGWTPSGNGTALAGLIAGHGNRLSDYEPGNRGALGVAPAAALLPVRTVGADLTGREAVALAAEGIAWAAANGAAVICYAAAAASQDLFAEAVAAARAADVVLVAAVGDRPDATEVWFPAAHPSVVAVAGIDRDGGHAAVSVTGDVTLTAPAVDVLTTSLEHGYAERTSTSVAAALVAGAAALVRAEFPDLSADEVVHRLVATASDRPPAGADERYGHGVLDVVAALTADVPPWEPSAPAAPTGPGGGAAPGDPGLIRTGLLVAGGLVTVAVLGTGVLLVRRRRDRDNTADPAAQELG